ncbi:MAG: murein biosynthesis integral membrane protein MurJ [Pseudomonadota bacterium]
MTSRPNRILRSFATVGGWTMASRVLGFLRDIAMATIVGTGPLAEAFFVAFRLPNMFRRFFAEGAFNTAFVPMFAARLEEGGKDQAKEFAQQAISGLFAALLILTLLAQLATPWLVWALASGFDAERQALAETFTRIVFPYIVFISLAALFSGVLNAFGRFAAAAAAPVLLNVIWIAALGLAWAAGWDVGLTLSWAIFAAGLAQLALVWMAAKRLGLGLLPRRPRLTPQMKRLVVVGIPAALAGGVMQINLLVGTQVASYFEGAVAWLWMADRVYQLPLGAIGVAIGVVLLPELARRFRAGDAEGTAHAMNRAGEFSLVFTLPSAVALVLVPQTIVTALFERGAFTAEDSAQTALALAVYGVGLPTFVLQKVLQPAFFAREDTRTPLRYAMISMVINLVVAIGLAPVIGFLAAAMATTLAGAANLWLLWRGVQRLSPEYMMDAQLASRLPRIALASLGMGAVILGIAHGLEYLLPGWAGVTVIAVVTGGMVSYGVFGFALGAFSISELKSALRRSKRQPEGREP